MFRLRQIFEKGWETLNSSDVDGIKTVYSACISIFKYFKNPGCAHLYLQKKKIGQNY